MDKIKLTKDKVSGEKYVDVFGVLNKVNELVGGYNEVMKRYNDLCKVIGFFGSNYDKLMKRLDELDDKIGNVVSSLLDE